MKHEIIIEVPFAKINYTCDICQEALKEKQQPRICDICGRETCRSGWGKGRGIGCGDRIRTPEKVNPSDNVWICICCLAYKDDFLLRWQTIREQYNKKEEDLLVQWKEVSLRGKS